jgi:DNA-binding NarL/FixJ family response regulator
VSERSLQKATTIPHQVVPLRSSTAPFRSSAAPLRVIDPVAVAIVASDPLTAEGTAAYLLGRPDITLLPVDSLGSADVVLVLETWVTDETLFQMELAAEQAGNREMRFVLVGDGVREPQLLRAVSCGLVSVLPRKGTDHERIVAAIVAVHKDRLEMPDTAVRWLVGHIRSIQRDVLIPNGLTAAGVESREVAVIRLLADGMDTQEIAGQLNYSERTVKNIIHGMLTRLNLRNRPHAVAFALRRGLLLA